MENKHKKAGNVASITIVSVGLISSIVIIIAAVYQLSQPFDNTNKSTDKVNPGLNDPDSSNLGTSAWCSGSSNIDRLCRFKNLCYSSLYDEFLFVHSPSSIMDGVPGNRFEPALVDLSSVADHNTQYFHFTDVHLDLMSNFDHIKFESGPYLLFNRFNPSNIMHVFHDDLLPLYFTLHHHNLLDLNTNQSLAILVALEGWHEDNYFEFYNFLSKDKPLLRSDLLSVEADLVCFEELYVGLSKTSLWYQYGFNQPQGPLSNKFLSAKEIKMFTNYFKSHLGIIEKTFQEKKIIILSRTNNRVILNENQLAFVLAQKFGCKVLIMSLESHSLIEVIGEVSSAFALIGVHGSLLILSMFLPFGSMLIEIFPYAINPDNYSPYKTLALLPGMGITYRPWRNMKLENTVTFPDSPAELGGIRHLDAEKQEAILTSNEVPLHLCCSDPEWLFRIYQDTHIDIPSFATTVNDALQEPEHTQKLPGFSEREDLKKIENGRMFPGVVNYIKCDMIENSSENHGSRFEEGSGYLKVTWSRPWNLDYLLVEEIIQYEVWVQEGESTGVKAYMVDSTEVMIEGGIHLINTYSVWVRCIADGKVGLISSASCNSPSS